MIYRVALSYLLTYIISHGLDSQVVSVTTPACNHYFVSSYARNLIHFNHGRPALDRHTMCVRPHSTHVNLLSSLFAAHFLPTTVPPPPSPDTLRTFSHDVASATMDKLRCRFPQSAPKINAGQNPIFALRRNSVRRHFEIKRRNLYRHRQFRY